MIKSFTQLNNYRYKINTLFFNLAFFLARFHFIFSFLPSFFFFPSFFLCFFFISVLFFLTLFLSFCLFHLGRDLLMNLHYFFLNLWQSWRWLYLSVSGYKQRYEPNMLSSWRTVNWARFQLSLYTECFFIKYVWPLSFHILDKSSLLTVDWEQSHPPLTEELKNWIWKRHKYMAVFNGRLYI